MGERGPGDAATASPGTTLTAGALRAELAAVLEAGGVALPRDEARDMIAALLDVPRFWPATNADAPVDAALRASALQAASRRCAGAPFAYAVGRSAYRHLTLDVDERVLIPRQETELLPELVLARVPRAGGTAVDIGTGSGAIALALATEGQFDRVIATDVSDDALAVARRNVALLQGALRARVELRLGAALGPVRGERAVAVVSNPPYIAFDEMMALPSSVRDWEPAVALCCGGDGMDVTVQIVREAAEVLEPGGVLGLEVDARRAALAAERVAGDARYRDVAVHLDLTGRERFVTAVRR
ncbi:MAG TPA: HemK/PrmC family methyltransferase [Gemmatimonadaceae bacterium]|nr:HemK/PrmC family methyltransferase [Gemmatimonadaceae bacterium]